MSDVTASRTLVKSPPELWTECSDAASLARHLDGFGEIRITRLEPETTVAWEGENASGTVRLEPSGWGTRVVLTATPAGPPGAHGEADAERGGSEEVEREGPFPGAEARAASAGAESESACGSDADDVPLAERRPRFFRRVLDALLGREEPVTEAEPVAAGGAPEPALEDEPPEAQAERAPGPEPEPEPAREPSAPPDPAARDASSALAAALDSLGQAHHRPFSRA